LRQLPWAHWSQVRGSQEPIGELQDVLAELSNVLAFALGIDGHPRQAGSSSTSGAKAKEKKQHTGSTMTPHILRQGKTSCYKEKAEAHRNAAGNHWRWNEG
jgi:hypothetical protein